MRPLVRELHSWIFDTALPFWAKHGVDRTHGGFHEQLNMDASVSDVGYKRTRLTARQIYVFSHAAVLGWEPGLELARHGVDFLTEKCWKAQEGGFARRVSITGAVTDPTDDLYDYAFALFALGWYIKASDDASAKDWAHKTLDAVDQRLRHPNGLGFLHESPPSGWRQQNPHMHLIEASLACFDATREDRYAELTHEISGLFSNYFFDSQSRTLAEFFEEDWTRAPAPDGTTIEPGHQMEWAWILGRGRSLLNLDVGSKIRALVSFSEEHGVNRVTGATYNAVGVDGKVLNAGSRVWPNTERMKGVIALHELDGTDPWPALEASARLLLDEYLSGPVAGLWTEEFDANGKATYATAPASSLYHLFLAFAETLRVDETDPA